MLIWASRGGSWAEAQNHKNIFVPIFIGLHIFISFAGSIIIKVYSLKFHFESIRFNRYLARSLADPETLRLGKCRSYRLRNWIFSLQRINARITPRSAGDIIDISIGDKMKIDIWSRLRWGFSGDKCKTNHWLDFGNSWNFQFSEDFWNSVVKFVSNTVTVLHSIDLTFNMQVMGPIPYIS